ncbi:MAG TPA: hypothetical protein DCZ20_07635 [Lachnospiraceae bacterium]|nr:hypothetical protein [Lachnospiraceae bacterium]
MSEKTIKKVRCNICASGCLMDAYVEDGKVVSVEGSKDTPMQNGGLCAKGAASRQYLYNKDRILYPMKQVGEKGSGKFERISWEEAYDAIAKKMLQIRETYGPQSAVFYVGYPKWFRPAMLRLANAYGSPNYCTESSTCFQASDLAWRATYGNHICFPDMMHANTIMLWSSNLYHSNTPMTKGYRKLKERGGKIIVVDPRKTVTAKDADIHLQLIPGTDGALALAMANVIIEENLYDKEFVEKYVYGFEEYRKYVREYSPERAAEITGVDAELIRKAARCYAGNGPAGIMFSVSTIVHNINGVQNYRAVQSLIALTGNYDIPGGNPSRPGPAVPLNEFGQVKRFNGIEAIGEKDFPVWFDLSCEEAQCTRLADYILQEDPYPIKAVLGFGLNHNMWPQPEYLQKALKTLDFYVNVDIFYSESCRMADIILPAASSFERDEVIRGRGGILSLSEKAVEPLGESKNDIEIILDLAKAMKLEDPVLQLNLEEYMQYILEPSGLTLKDLREHPEGMKGKNVIPPEFKTYEKRPFNTPSGKVEFVSQALNKYEKTYGYKGLPEYQDFREISEVDREEYPFILNTGSRKPQYFHSRTYRMSWLNDLEGSTLIEMHPEDAKKLSINEKDPVLVSSPAGKIEGTASFCVNGKQGMVNIYHGNQEADANELIARDYLDPISGFPGYKSYFCKVEKRG